MFLGSRHALPRLFLGIRSQIPAAGLFTAGVHPMIRPWFRALARKVLPGQELQAARRGRRRGVCLHCEVLEDRVLMYAANFDQLQLLPPTPAGQRAIVSVVQGETVPGQMLVSYDVVRFAELNAAGLDQLLADLHAPTIWPTPAPSPPSPSQTQPESALPPSVPPPLNPFGGPSRPDGVTGRVGPDAPPIRHGDTDLPTRPVAPPESSAPPPGG